MSVGEKTVSVWMYFCDFRMILGNSVSTGFLDSQLLNTFEK